MTERPTFSIVVPTRNRTETLKSTLATCLDQRRFDDYEIVVNDNGDDDTTSTYIANLKAADDRAALKLKYRRRSEVCCMADNFDDAISRTAGQYIIVLGDDDGILPMALYEIDALLRRTGARVLRWRNGLYTWSDMTIEASADYLGFSVVRDFAETSGKEELEACLRHANYERLPMLYINAAVHSDLVREMRDEDGKLFHARSPDVYSGMVLAYRCGCYLDVTVPFTLAGLSRHSNGVSSAFAGSNSLPRADFDALNRNVGLLPHPHVPDLAIYPMVALAESFYYAKEHHFPNDETVSLSRASVMEACVARADTADEAVKRELLRACADDPALTAFTRDLIARKTATIPQLRLKPLDLGYDGTNLHLDARDFGIANVADAVALVHRIVWPNGAPLRYDVPDTISIARDLERTLAELDAVRRTLKRRSADLAEALAELGSNRAELAHRSADLAEALAELGSNRAELAQRSADLAEALAELGSNRAELAQRSADLTEVLIELKEVRGILVERTARLEAAQGA